MANSSNRTMVMAGRLVMFVAAVLCTVAAQGQTRPKVYGAVFGGGRMANVTGNAVVTVNNCDTVAAVFGGNDIAGTVAGSNGSTVNIGTATTSARVSVGSVYGGGNGYYAYNGTSFTAASTTNTSYSVASNASVKRMNQNRSVGTVEWTNITNAAKVLNYPSIAKTSITVNTDYVRIDSLFGGAKNAFISTENDTNTRITINAGVVYAVFGGNNYGGTLGAYSMQRIRVDSTLESTTSSVNLGGNYATGHAWTSNNSEKGIRYLFGGGNEATGQNACIYIHGGQIDTLFGGGNSADVASAYVSVDVNFPLYTLAQSPYVSPNTPYNNTTSVFDIRCLFGGNNAADMTGLPTLSLTKGGVHNVYGGGNKGIMKASVGYDDNYTLEANAGSTFVPTHTTHHAAGATKSTSVVLNSADFIADTVYGGGQSAGTLHDTYVEIAAGNVGVVYGGTNIQGRIGPDENLTLSPRDEAKSNVYIHGGTVHNTVFGASNGLYRCHNGLDYESGTNSLFPGDAYLGLKGKPTPSIFNSYVYITTGATVLGSVYGGGNMAVVGKPDAVTSSPDTSVGGIAILHIDGGTFGAGNPSTGTITHEANIYGGGNMGCIFGGTSLVISGDPVIYGNVYGGNDKTGRVYGILHDYTNILEMAHTSTVSPIAVSTSEYGGLIDNNLAANAGITLNNQNAQAYTLIQGTPKIWGTVYGGSNGDYTYYNGYDEFDAVSDNTFPEGDTVIYCDVTPDASERSSFVDININKTASTMGYINRVFGGGNSKTSGNDGSNIGQVYVYMNCIGDEPTNDTNNIQVGTIFGGNNNVAMDRVPRIVLLKGKVGNVYGGGNMGSMTNDNTSIDQMLVSTYVTTPSNKVVVAKNIYGGCNVADVAKDTYVKITQGIIRGNVFGGNDLSGEVGIAHVTIDGAEGKNLNISGNVYGGGNGDYAFYRYSVEEGTGKLYFKADPNSEKQYAPDGITYPYINGQKVGASGSRTLDIYYQNLKGRPYVDSTAVVLNGTFVMTGNVYGGGISGDCRKTNVLVDAENGDFGGMIFGAGRGKTDNMGLRINGTCHDRYFAVATGKDNEGNVIYRDTATAMGNVLDTAFLTVRRFKSMGYNGGRSAMFGGGQSGHVGTTMVKYENTADKHLDALYLGCLASNVLSANGIINANEDDLEHAIIDTIYGGNDFSGRVDSTFLTVNSGVFTHIFGAGNGDYKYKDAIAAGIAAGTLNSENTARLAVGGCYDTVPYSMNVEVTINGGQYLNIVYGGGNMGLVGNRDMVADNMVAANTSRHNDIGSIILTIHDGVFHRHIFAGARGKTDMEGKRFFGLGNSNNVEGQELGKQLAYALKILNMDGGHVQFSVYGGSEAVDDGFPYECKDKTYTESAGVRTYTQSTLRPSSIMNITGGRVEKSVYGGGYQGNIYGSVFVNIGIDAVRDCPAWSNTYGPAGATFTLASYKPNLPGHSGYRITNTLDNNNKVVKSRETVSTSSIARNATLTKDNTRPVDLEASVYGASDWGEAGSNAYFNTRGVFGGVTNILIDGKGYYTSLTNAFDVELPGMNISNSIIGAGTSTEGGDVNRLITMRHFGDYACPEPSKTLFSIQRADKVVLDSVFINLLGEQDAFSAYASPSYSFCRIDTLLFRVDNIVTIESPGIYIGNLASMKTDEVCDIRNPYHIYDTLTTAQPVINPDPSHPEISTVPNDFFDNLAGRSSDCENNNQCEHLDACLKLPTDRGQANNPIAANVLMMRNGSYMKIYPFVDVLPNAAPDGIDDGGHNYGEVFGWMYLLAQDNTMSYVYAGDKDGSTHTDNGGFIAPCYCDNFSGDYDNEIDFTNVTAQRYRSWKVGTKEGTRVRHITLVANAIPDGRLNYALGSTSSATNFPLYVGSKTTAQDTSLSIAANSGYAYATSYLELPPADGGSFYVINSVLIDQDNGGQLNLVDQGYNSFGSYFVQTADNATSLLPAIAGDPDYTFGLTFVSGENFDNDNCWNTTGTTVPEQVTAMGTTRNLTDGNGTRYPCWNRTTISGNQYITQSGGYISNAIVSGAAGAIPTMSFTLTYNTNLHSTITRDVIFTMFEFDKNGHYVGPVEITVTISTVIKDFADLEAPVMAMFNEGISNEYVRKVTIPASFQQRDIYVEGIEWMKDDITPDNSDGNRTVYKSSTKKKWFNMVAYDPNHIVETNNQFAVIVKPTESTSENINNTLGWYHIEHSEGIDVYKTAKDDYEATFPGQKFIYYDSVRSRLTGEDSITRRTDSIYCSWDLNHDGTGDGHNSDVTNMGKGGAEGKGLWLGTLDGRSTASIDVALKFNGMYYYHKQFDPPLAWVRLKCHWYSTKSDEDGTFYIKVKIRTRKEGDTIYMAPEKMLTRTVTINGQTQTLKLHAYGYNPAGTGVEMNTDIAADAVPNYNAILSHKDKIKDNPNNYLQRFTEVMRIYDEGDVIAIMGTIPITSTMDPISVMGDDYSTIQIIRYSGSHYKFPSLACANRDALIDVSGSFLTMRNVWFNGSGCTRTKGDTNVSAAAHLGGGQVTEFGSTRFFENHRRVNALLYANAPVIRCHGNSNVSFTKRVIITNNFNQNYDRDTSTDATNANFIGGGAIAVERLANEENAKPRLLLGDLCHLYDNLVVDWNAATLNMPGGISGTSDSLPRNYGGAVYVNGGELVLGSGGNNAELHIERNYYLKNLSDNAGIQTKIAHVFKDENEVEMEEKRFEVYYLDTLEHASNFALSNIYLTRKPKVCSNPEDSVNNNRALTRLDAQSDVVYFLSEMTENSRVGISKWFPGYVYTNSRTEGYNKKNETMPRDTIAVARIGKGKSNTSMVDNNYNANIFFNDSAYYSIADRPNDPQNPTVFHPAETPSFTYAYPNVAYSRNTTGYPRFNDRVFIYRHTSLDQYNIYFQRCASFGKGITQIKETGACFENDRGLMFNRYVKGDSISYHLNKTATCALAMDTVHFKVGGGFFPYTYKWSEVTTVPSAQDPLDEETVLVPMHTRVTTGSNAISRFDVPEYAALRRKAEFDTLVIRVEMRESSERLNYTFRVEATDLTGNCPVTQDVKIRAVKVATDHHDDGKYLYDYDNFLLHRKHGAVVAGTSADTAAQRATEAFYRIECPGVDSSSFHDHEGHTPRHDVGSTDYHGGILRAGWTHIANCDSYDQSANDGAGNGNTDFSGKSYKGDGSCDTGDMTPRYLRLFRSYRVKPSIYPVEARGNVVVNDMNGNLLSTITTENMSNDNWHPDFEVCPGEVLHLIPTPASPSWEFIGWDFDPSAPMNASYTVANDVDGNRIQALFAPGDYWWQVVTKFVNSDVVGDEHTATLKDYYLDYYGNVTIKTNKGLAWLISTVNGYNNQNAQTFHFNTITIDSTLEAPINMQAHKWTPLGNVNNPFEGVFEGNGKHVSNVIVNETTIPLVGMFGHTRGATIQNFTVDSTLVRGNTYVSAIVGEAMENTVVQNITIQRGYIIGEYTIGGLISHMVNSSLLDCQLKTTGNLSGPSKISAFGNTIYAGGFIGLAEGNNYVHNNAFETGYIDISKLSTIYVGAILGYNKGTVTTKKRSKTQSRTILNNNYARLVTSNKAQRVGGLVGYAENIDMNNNYVYGSVDYDKQFGFAGGLVGFVGDNVSINNCYFIDGMTDNMVGYTMGTMPQKSTTFKGTGNNVVLTQPVDGYTNLTRALNAWVRDNGDTIYNTWRSDLEDNNNGLPLFGEPDLIPVKDTLETVECDAFEFDGITFDQSGIYVFHVVDSSDFVDSTFTLMLTINHSDSTMYSDTVHIGEGYEGYGFNLTPEQLHLNYFVINRFSDVLYVMKFVDSLTTASGCDSLVVLTLYVVKNSVDAPDVQKLTDVKVYPNPTRGTVNVEGSDLESIEVYDNVSHRVLQRKVTGDKTTFDLSDQAAGSYYIRVRTAHGTVVKKLIKK